MKVFGLEARKTYPTKITIDANTHCNAKCTICPYPQLKDKLKHGVMEWDLYQKIIDDYANICYSKKIMGELSYCNMSEPTLLPNFSEYISYARQKGCFTISFNTNGSNLKPKIIDTFTREKTYPTIHLNIMGFNKKNYAKTMGLDFDSLISNLTYLLKKYPHCLIDVGFFTPLMDTEEIKAVKSFFEKTKVTVYLSDDISNRANNLDVSQNMVVAQSRIRQTSFACSKNRPIHRMHINFDGRVYLCDQDMNLETNFGNIKNNTIERIWNGGTMMETLHILYGRVMPNADELLPCLKCEACIDDKQAKLFRNPKDYKPRKIFGPLKRGLVKNGWAVVKKRGKLQLLWT